MGTTIGAGLFGSAIDLAVARYSRRKVAKTYIFHFLYTTMNIGAIAALYGVDWALAATDGWSGYRLLFSIGAAGSVVACWITFLYDESKHLPETLIVQEDDESVDVDAGSAVQQFTLRSALAILVEPDLIRLFVFSLVFTGVRSVFRYMETLLSVYLTRVYPEIPYGGVLAINPILIIILTPMMGMVTVHLLRDYWWMVAGSLLSALAPLLVYVWTGSSSIWSVYLFLAFFTLGEAIWSPKVKEWIIEKSPNGKKGIYSGLIPLSTFGGTIISGIVSGHSTADLGSDTYLFNLGDGVDRIYDYPGYGEQNRVVFGSGIRFEELSVSMDTSFGGVAIDVGGNGDRLELPGTWPDPYSVKPVSIFGFADGTVATFDALTGYGLYLKGEGWDEWLGGGYYADSIYGNGGNDYLDGFEGDDILSGGAGDDQLSGDWGNDTLAGGDGNDSLLGGDGNDDLAGGAGNDQLFGGIGNDTYRFGLGDGVDTVGDIAYGGEGNQVVFGAGITAADLRLGYTGNTLEITVGTGGDMLRLEEFYSWDPYGPHAVESFVFADGAVLSYGQLIDRGFDIAGSGGDDILNGTNAVDRIDGVPAPT